jgi:hypothetical protein
MSMTSGFPFTPIICCICSFFILSILDFRADRNTSICVDKTEENLWTNQRIKWPVEN